MEKDIKVAKCCGICDHAIEMKGGALTSVGLYCCLLDEEVWSHETCSNFELCKECEEEFEIELEVE